MTPKALQMLDDFMLNCAEISQEEREDIMEKVKRNDKKWCDGKTKVEINDEMWRQIETYDFKTLKEFFFDLLDENEKIQWVNSWYDNGE